jgi:hypothetical protein
MDAAVKRALEGEGRCSDDPGSPPLCASYCVCLVREYAAPEQIADCPEKRQRKLRYVRPDGVISLLGCNSSGVGVPAASCSG